MSAKDTFFQQMASLRIALTYDDVRLRTGRREARIMPDKVNTASWFSRTVPLKIPIVSAAMDTVTEAPMAIALARLGGLGIIHKNLTPKQQAAAVGKVKFSQHGLIPRPATVREYDKVEAILNRRAEKEWTFHTFPVLNDDDKLVGVITETDFAFCIDTSMRARDIMTTDLITAPEGTDTDDAYVIMMQHKKKMLPIVDAEGRVAGMYVFSDVNRIATGRSEINNVDEQGRLRVGAAIGVGDEALERVELLVKRFVDVVVIDTAHADSEPVTQTLGRVKESYPDLDVVAGNISEPESALRLIKAGADGIKVGQGPGSICTTRPIAGIGSPQVTAVYNCARAAARSRVPVCADGGLRFSGDIPIAIGAGAHSVMLGAMLAGTEESPGKIVYYQGRRWKSYRGMGSLGAMLTRQGSRERYSQPETGKSELIPEGVEGLIPYKGSLTDAVFQYVGGLKRGMGYVGAATVEELREIADFIRITSAGQTESHPHDVVITEESPNYQQEGD